MLKSLARNGLIHGVTRVPGLRRLPMLKLLAAGEIALLARTHITKLDAVERRRFIELMRKGHGRPSTLSPDQPTPTTRPTSRAWPSATSTPTPRTTTISTSRTSSG